MLNILLKKFEKWIHFEMTGTYWLYRAGGTGSPINDRATDFTEVWRALSIEPMLTIFINYFLFLSTIAIFVWMLIGTQTFLFPAKFLQQSSGWSKCRSSFWLPFPWLVDAIMFLMVGTPNEENWKYLMGSYTGLSIWMHHRLEQLKQKSFRKDLLITQI